MSEFGDRPFIAGSLIGLRAFRVDNLGRLTGVTHRDVWTPGENVAVCHRDRVVMGGMTFYVSSAGTTTTTSPTTFNPGGPVTATEPSYVQMTQPRGRKKKRGPGPEYAVSDKPALPAPSLSQAAVRPTPPPEPPHELVSLRCNCGFYAYFDGSNDYLSGNGLVVNWNGLSNDDRGVRLAAIVEGYGKVVVGSRGFRAEKARILALIQPPSQSGREFVLSSKVVRNYAVPVFDCEQDALREFPLTDPDPITPETDEDFWTRSAR